MALVSYVTSDAEIEIVDDRPQLTSDNKQDIQQASRALHGKTIQVDDDNVILQCSREKQEAPDPDVMSMEMPCVRAKFYVSHGACCFQKIVCV